ncbi:coiled-coil domain-containing protein 150 [Electrophorus electricus]|uniref:coiled-coil domain-containing protein 150 n=1 Tax=Electrophorus electricus TaxID=8005 RepID=UPI0015CFF72C|nr:coiled-coil domain-containing protein 150 [Electrophorus electricus]
MSRPTIPPLSVGATAPESLSLLQQRLLVAKRQAEELAEQLDSLGASREQLQARTSDRTPPPRPLSPVKVYRALRPVGDGVLWRQCESLVGRVCRLESLLHTLKLTTFRLETERELNPSHTARLQERLAALQEQCEEEQRSSQREVMRLRDQLQQACEEREEARQEAHRLRQELDISHSSKMDVAMATDELKVVKVQMSQKLRQMKEELEQETVARLEAEQSHNALLQRVEEIEGVVERERQQVKVLQTDCHALRVDGQEARAELEDKDNLIQYLQEECQQLRDQLGHKEDLISELTKELKSVRIALQKQQQENSRLVKDGGELRAAADKVQELNNQLDTQFSDLSSALHSLTVENNRLQISLKAEQEHVAQRVKEQDLLLDSARRNIQSELQEVLADRLLIKKELEVLRSDHVRLQQSSAVALETAVTHQELLERTIERLREEVSSAVRNGETMQKEKDEMTTTISKLEKERNSLETQLAEFQEELFETNSTLQNREEENKGLMGRLEAVQHQQQVEQVLQQLLDSKNKLAYENSKLQTQVQQLEVECTMERQTSSSLESKYTQVSTELRCVKLNYESLQEQLKQAKRDLRMKDCEVCMLGEDMLREQLTTLQLQPRDMQNTKALQMEVGGKEQELRTLQRERLRSLQEIQKLKEEVENLHSLLKNTMHEEKVAVVGEALDTAQVDNRKLSQNLEQTLHAKREAELDEARKEIGHLTEQVDTLSQQLQREKNYGRKLADKEISELKKALDKASARSGDLSQANRELREKFSELEKIVSSQKSRIKAQKAQLKQHLDNRTALAHSKKVKDLEAEITSLENSKNEYEKKCLEQSQSLLQVRNEMVSLQTELQSLSSSQQGELQAARDLTHRLQEKCKMLEMYVARLREERDEAEVKMREVSLESQQISDNLQEAHCWFRAKFESLKTEVEQNGVEPLECAEQSRGTSRDSTTGSLTEDTGKVLLCVAEPEVERWESTLQRWETKRELARIAQGCKPTG